MDVGRKRAIVKKSTIAHLKQQVEASALAPKVMLPSKAAPKRNGMGRMIILPRRGRVNLLGQTERISCRNLPHPPCYGVGP